VTVAVVFVTIVSLETLRTPAPRGTDRAGDRH
jgi:hypothetical protein